MKDNKIYWLVFIVVVVAFVGFSFVWLRKPSPPSPTPPLPPPVQKGNLEFVGKISGAGSPNFQIS